MMNDHSVEGYLERQDTAVLKLLLNTYSAQSCDENDSYLSSLILTILKKREPTFLDTE